MRFVMYGTRHGTKLVGIARIVNQIGEGAAFGALIALILWTPHIL
jgi:hypothetical protein